MVTITETLGQHLVGRCSSCRQRLGQCTCFGGEPSTAARGADGPRYDHEPDWLLEQSGPAPVRLNVDRNVYEPDPGKSVWHLRPAVQCGECQTVGGHMPHCSRWNRPRARCRCGNLHYRMSTNSCYTCQPIVDLTQR